MTEAIQEKEVQSSETISEQSTFEQTTENTNIEELAIVVVAHGLNPKSFTPDFLVHSGIIPADWVLARKPVVNPQIAQIAFQNGVSLIAQPGKVTFSESVGTKTDDDLMIAELATKYVEAMPQANYTAIGINPQKVEVFNNKSQDVQTFITQSLLQPGAWQEIGTQPMQASLKLFYQFEKCNLQLNLTPTELRLPDDVRVPGLLFSGNFHYEFSSEDAQVRKQEISDALSQWTTHLSEYRVLVAEKFLSCMR
ncbi:MAG: hypothetical protein AAFQ68_28100 [Bacteroidota bacterium]